MIPKRAARSNKRGESSGPVRLTEDQVEALTVDGRDRIVFDVLQPGFGVRITPAGAKIYFAQARVGGRPKRVRIGQFPTKKVVDARLEARGALIDMRAGRDPKLEKVARAKAVEAGQTTVSDLAERWYREYVEPKLKPRTAYDYRRLLDQRIKPALGHLIVSRVTKDDVNIFHAGMKAIPRRANYATAVFRSLMTFAEDCNLRPPMSNPARRIKLYRETSRERFLSEDELRAAVSAIASTEKAGRIGPHAAAGLRLALFTGARSGEILSAKWEYVDWNRRIIRLPDSKTGDARTIHLSEAALAVLEGLAHVGPYIIAGAVKGEAYRSLTRAWVECRGKAGLSDVRLHDLRHSFASHAAANGVSLQMIGKLLGHKVAATTARYAHLARDAAADVNDQLGVSMAAVIAKGDTPKPDNVVKLPRRRRRK